MCGVDMFIQLVSDVKCLVAVFAVVGERARKVNILNVVLRVGPLPINHSAQGASVLCIPLIHNLLNVFKQHFACEPWKELFVLKRFISAVWVVLSVFFVNVFVELVFRGEDMTTVLAGVLESLRKVDIFKVIQRVAFPIESLLTETALESIFLATSHNVVFQRFSPCNQHLGHL